MALISQSDLEARLGRSLTSAEAPGFSGLNNAIQSEVERIIGSSVEAAELSTRYYDGGLHNTPIDPCTDITTITYVNDSNTTESTLLSTDFTAEPINRTLKRALRCRYGKFYRGINNLTVRAKFSIYGDSAMLAEIKEIMLESLVSEYENNEDVIKESIEGWSVEYATSTTKNNLSRISRLFPEII